MSGAAAAYFDCKQRGGIADLSDRLLLRFTGADRVRYLNGQVTADVRKLAPGAALPACVTTAKGRLCGEVFIHSDGDALLVDADAVLRVTLPARFERYIIADDVMLEELSGNLRLIHVVGSASHSNRFGTPGLDLFIAPERFEETWAQLAADRVGLEEPLRELLRIEAGIPRWGRELGEDTLPPEAGLDRTHIDYHKGCYIGQEVISRLKSVGHVNRALTGFTGDRALTPGTALFSKESGDRAIGTLTSAAWSFALEKHIALGYLKRGSPTRDLIARPADSNGAEAVVAAHPLPFVP